MCTVSVCLCERDKDIESVWGSVVGGLQQEVESMVHGKRLMELFLLGTLVRGGLLDLGPVHTDANYSNTELILESSASRS